MRDDLDSRIPKNGANPLCAYLTQRLAANAKLCRELNQDFIRRDENSILERDVILPYGCVPLVTRIRQRRPEERVGE